MPDSADAQHTRVLVRPEDSMLKSGIVFIPVGSANSRLGRGRQFVEMTVRTVITHVSHTRSLAVVQYRPTMKLGIHIMEGLRGDDFHAYREYVTIARKNIHLNCPKTKYSTEL